jgi:glyceraldehyde 3-phosphate dehydrogenase
MDKNVRVAINGFGRIGRAFFKLALNDPRIMIVAINDLGDAENLAYLLKYDTVYGRGRTSTEIIEKGGEKYLKSGGKEILLLSEREPANLPWKNLDIDVAIEATGMFESFEDARAHIDAGAKRVVISAPAKGCEENGPDGATVLMGVNEVELSTSKVSSNASCTTNAGGPVMQILDDAIGIEKAVLNTVHAYTATQRLVDSPDAKDFRRGRAGAQNIIPSTTGAAVAVTKAIKGLSGKFDGIAIRVPVQAGSIADITFISKRDTTVEEVNEVLKNGAQELRWKGIFAVTEEPLVSSDIIGDTRASIADLSFTKVVGGNLVKVLAWYDNEMGYAKTLVEHTVKAASYI